MDTKDLLKQHGHFAGHRDTSAMTIEDAKREQQRWLDLWYHMGFSDEDNAYMAKLQAIIDGK